MSPGGTPEILVFSDDWGRHVSSCQHLIRELLPRYKVCWVNTIGTRRPALSPYSIRRAAGKLRGWTAPRAVSPEANLRVLDPVMWPSFKTRFGRRLNRWILQKALHTPVDDGVRRIAVTTIPIVADLVGLLPVERWVYYCVDDMSRWPGLDRSSLEALERKLAARVDTVVAASESLVERIESMGRRASLLTHGVDLGHWAARSEQALPELEVLPQPRIVFWGVVDRRLETEWLRRLSDQLGQGTILLVGPTNDPDPAIRSIPRVNLAGPRPYAVLPRVAQLASVLIMPYADLLATRAMQPLKLKEYLATSKPCVVSSLPAVKEWQDTCDVVTTAAEFCQRVLERLQTGLPSPQAVARSRLTEESWEHKSQAFESVLVGHGG